MAKKIQGEDGKTYVQKKPFYKRVWFWILVVIVVIGVGSQMGANSGSSKAGSSDSASKKTDGITKAKFDKITVSDSNGTTEADVQKSFGKKASSTSEDTIESVQSKMYTWNGVAGGDITSNVVIGFSNDHAISKNISGLKVSRANKIKLSDFSAISNGMSKADVEKKFGKPNGYDITNIAGYSAEMWDYTSGVKGDVGANFNVTFENGVVSGKAQTSMK